MTGGSAPDRAGCRPGGLAHWDLDEHSRLIFCLADAPFGRGVGLWCRQGRRGGQSSAATPRYRWPARPGRRRRGLRRSEPSHPASSSGTTGAGHSRAAHCGAEGSRRAPKRRTPAGEQVLIDGGGGLSFRAATPFRGEVVPEDRVEHMAGQVERVVRLGSGRDLSRVSAAGNRGMENGPTRKKGRPVKVAGVSPSTARRPPARRP